MKDDRNVKNRALNLLPALLKRESGYASIQKHSLYGALYPNRCVKLRTAEATNIQFSPCGAYILGLNSNSHSVSVWDVEAFLSPLSPAKSAPQRSCARPASSNFHAGDANEHAPRPRDVCNQADASSGSTLGLGAGATSANGACSSADVPLPRKPAVAFSTNLLAQLKPIWQGEKRVSLGKRGSGLGSHILAPVEVRDDSGMMEQARSVLCTPAQPLDDAQLQQAWDRRGREQQALIASWNQSRKRLRQSRHAAATATTTPSTASGPNPAPPGQPAVVRAPCRRPALQICGCSAEHAPEEVTLPSGSAALVATVAAGHEKLNDSICLYTRNRAHLLLLAEAQPQSSSDVAASMSSSIIMVSMRTGAVVDRVQFMNERLVLQRNRSCVSWSLRDDTLVVLCPSAQQVHVYHVSGDSLVHNRTLGAHLRHDDELVVSNLAAKEQQHRSAVDAEKGLAAHGNLLPGNTAEARSGSVDPPASSPSERSNRGGGGVGQQANRSGSAAQGGAAAKQDCHITGIKQRIQAFVYQSALQGEDLGVGHLFQASGLPDNTSALDAIVRILHCNDSLVGTLVAMSKLCVQKELSDDSQTQADRVARAVGRFHRFRSGLDEASIAAVHALDDSHMLMLLQVPSSAKIPLLVLYNWHTDRMLFVGTVMSIKVLVCLMWYSHELTNLHDACMWKYHMPHTLVMQQQLKTLAEQAQLSSPHVPTHGSGSSGMVRSRSWMHRPSSTSSFSQLISVHNAQSSSTARSTDKPDVKNLREQVAAVLEDATRVGPERMEQFLLWHLPGASQGSWASPYTNPLLFTPIRKDRIVHFHGSRTLRFSASGSRIQFFSGSSPEKQVLFDLDWSTMVADLDPSDASQPKFCDVKFHPFLPLVITCFPSLSCFCVHYR